MNFDTLSIKHLFLSNLLNVDFLISTLNWINQIFELPRLNMQQFIHLRTKQLIMKKVLLLFLGMGIISFTCAQQTNLSVISPAGNRNEIPFISLEWTLGELAVIPLKTPEGMLTQGFHQPLLVVEESEEVPPIFMSNQIDVKVMPNPTMGSLFIVVDSKLEESVLLSLKTFSGTILQSTTITFSQEEFEWNMINYPAGIYLLTVQGLKDEIIKSLKITKY
jgi:hypothetical protein